MPDEVMTEVVSRNLIVFGLILIFMSFYIVLSYQPEPQPEPPPPPCINCVMKGLAHAPQVILPPDKSLNFTFVNRTLIFVASGLPLKIEPSDIEYYMLYYRDYGLKYMRIVAPPNVTVRIVNNYSTPVSLVFDVVEVPPGYMVVHGELVRVESIWPDSFYEILSFIVMVLGSALLTAGLLMRDRS